MEPVHWLRLARALVCADSQLVRQPLFAFEESLEYMVSSRGISLVFAGTQV